MKTEEIPIDLISENGTVCLKCHLIKRPQEKPIQKPRSYFVDTKGHSISTYELIFSFDYLINNRLTHSLWIYPCKTNKEKVDKYIDILKSMENYHKIELTRKQTALLFLLSFFGMIEINNSMRLNKFIVSQVLFAKMEHLLNSHDAF